MIQRNRKYEKSWGKWICALHRLEMHINKMGDGREIER